MELMTEKRLMNAHFMDGHTFCESHYYQYIGNYCQIHFSLGQSLTAEYEIISDQYFVQKRHQKCPT